MTQPLSYSSPEPPTPTIALHQIAQLCGVVPLGLGTFVFLMFLLTRDRGYALLGAATVLLGVCMAFVGAVCALVYLYHANRAAPNERTRARRLGQIDIAVILINFPVALLMALIGGMMLDGW